MARDDEARRHGADRLGPSSRLEESEARLKAILSAAVDGIITIDEHGVIESLNPAAARLFGYSAEELVGSKVNRLMPASYRERHDDFIERYLETGEARIIGIGREVEGERSDGTVFPLELAVGEVELPGRRLFTGIVRDISDRRRAEQASHQRLSNTAHTARLLELGEMVSSIAHEVNQPLAAIVSFAQACLRLLRDEQTDREVIADALRQISEQGQRAGAIIQRLRQLSRRGGTRHAWIDVNETIREVIPLVAHDLERTGVRLTLGLHEALPPILADKVQIEQVVLNLTRNAIEAMEDSEVKELSIHSALARGEVEVDVAVADTGTGLPEGAAQRVFDTFFTTKEGGVGIGLAISRSIIEAHRGKLAVRDLHGGGAEFRFSLPVGSADE